jgi:thermostable 8-oxoguanine DNA glycosylase
MKQYLKYYYLEDYLFKSVSNNFHKNKFLAPEEFLAIIIWKRNASKTKVIEGIKASGKSIRSITNEIYNSPDRETKLHLLCSIKHIRYALASAVLTVLYDKEFTVIDYRVKNSLMSIGVKITGSPDTNADDYFAYVDICKKLAKKYNLSLRELDMALWARDFYAGKGGLKEIAGKLK